MPDNAKIGWFFGFNPYSNYSNDGDVLNFSDGTLEHLVRIETPLTFVIQVDGTNTGAE